MKKYRVSASEHFNLLSMYDKLKCQEIDMNEHLMEKAYCVGALVSWQTLKRIREIKEERQLIRYNTCIAQGASENDAALAFQL